MNYRNRSNSQGNYYQVLNVISRIFRYLPARRKRQFFILLAGMVIVALLEIVSAGALAFFGATLLNPDKILKSVYILKLQLITNIHLFTGFNGFLFILSLFLIFLFAAKNIIQGVTIYFSARYSIHCGNQLSESLLNGFLHLPHEWHLSQNSADLIQSVAWRQQIGVFLNALLKTLGNLLIVALLLLSILFVKPGISVPLIGIMGLLAYFFFFRFRKYLDKVSEKLKDCRIATNRHVHKALYGLKDIKVYGRESLFFRKFQNLIYKEAKLQSLQQVLPQMPGWFLEVFSIALVCGLVCFFFLVMKTSSVWGIGYIIFLAVVARRVIPKLTQIIQSLSQLRINLPYINYDLEYLKIIDHLNPPEALKTADAFQFKESLKLQALSFYYDGSDITVLKDINFKIRKGETIGIIGTSGAGKSTLVDVIIGLLSPKAGQFKIDNRKTDASLIRAWMQKIGYVPQDPYICIGSLAENVAFGYAGDKIDRDRVAECCHMAAMDDFLWKLPNGIDTEIGQRGVKLSGGQRQRVSIARALYHGPEVLIFDEATSSLDTKSEKAIQKTIYSFKGKQTLIIIAHRLTTVKDCDKLIWLEHGQVKRIGPPDDVLPNYRASMNKESMATVI